MTNESGVIYLVDDDASYLTAVSRLLCAAGFAVESFNSAAAFLSHITSDMHGCVVADLHMPGMNGLELQEALIATGNPIPVIFLTGDGDIPTTVLAIRRGAEDFLCKRAPRNELLDAVRRALARDGRQRAATDRVRQLRAPFQTLTPRDREVLTHVLGGRLNKQIARNLGIDERSVKRHRTSIMTKLRAESVVELTHLVHAAGLHPPNGEIATPRP